METVKFLRTNVFNTVKARLRLDRGCGAIARGMGRKSGLKEDDWTEKVTTPQGERVGAVTSRPGC